LHLGLLQIQARVEGMGDEIECGCANSAQTLQKALVELAAIFA
jgi:hypothetical protein